MYTKHYLRNRNIYVWLTVGRKDGCLANATRYSVENFRRQGDTFRQATLSDWHKAMKCIIIYK